VNPLFLDQARAPQPLVLLRERLYASVRSLEMPMEVKRNAWLRNERWGQGSDLLRQLERRPILSYRDIPGASAMPSHERVCEACRDRRHPYEVAISIAGGEYDARDLRALLHGDLDDAADICRRAEPAFTARVGRWCLARIDAFHSFTHFSTYLALRVRQRLAAALRGRSATERAELLPTVVRQLRRSSELVDEARTVCSGLSRLAEGFAPSRWKAPEIEPMAGEWQIAPDEIASWPRVSSKQLVTNINVDAFSESPSIGEGRSRKRARLESSEERPARRRLRPEPTKANAGNEGADDVILVSESKERQQPLATNDSNSSTLQAMLLGLRDSRLEGESSAQGTRARWHAFIRAVAALCDKEAARVFLAALPPHAQ
jgi:hypothetical protein